MVATKISVLTVSIHGARGSGKSTIAELLKKQLEAADIYYEKVESHMSDKSNSEVFQVFLVHKSLPSKIKSESSKEITYG